MALIISPFSEADTLATVTGRGASTTTAVILNGGLSTGTASTGVTRGMLNADGDFLSFYSTESNARVKLGRDVGISGGAGLALGGALYALIASSDTNGSALYFKLNAAAGTASTSPHMTLTTTGLGIGTTSPAAKLDVSSTAASAGINITKANSGTVNENGGILNFYNYAPANQARAAGTIIGQIYFGASQPTSAVIQDAAAIKAIAENQSGINTQSALAFFTAASAVNAEKMRLDSSGNLGIGNTSPARKLDVNGPVRIADANVIEWGGTSTALVGSSSTNTMQFFTASSERMRIDSSGNVGIGVVPVIGYGTSIQLKNTGGATSALLAQSITTTDQIVSLSNNALPPAGGYTGTYNYTTSSTASLYELRNNVHTWYNAPSGIAGATTTVTSGQVYIVTALGSSTLAQWQALFSSLVALPTVDAALNATATGTLAGGATVTQRISFNSAMKLDANSNLLLGTTTATNKLTIYTGNTSNANEGISLTRGPGPDNVFGMRLKSDGTGQYRNAITSKSSTDAEIEVITILPTTGNVGIATTAPTQKLQVAGTIYSSTGGFKFPDGTTQTTAASGTATTTYVRTVNTATAAQTVFSATYTVGYLEVYLNGLLLPAADYTASNGTSVTLSVACAAGDILETVAYAIAAIGTGVTTGKAIAMAMIFGG